MQTIKQSQASETIKVGPDLVTITRNQITIDALHEISDWQVREFARIPIYVGDWKFFLRERQPSQKPFAMRYVLERWPEDCKQPITTFFSYDEESVAEREAAVKSGKADDFGRAALIIFYPLLGMLWSRTKEKLVRFGFVSRSITGVSIFVTFGLLLLQGVFAKMLIMTSLRTGKIVIGGMIRAYAHSDYLNLWLFEVRILWLDCALLLFLFLDCIIRYSQHLRDAESPWGFLEWLTCLIPRRTAPAAQLAQRSSN